jgi:hypothetical protein
MPKFSCVDMKNKRPDRVQARVQAYPTASTRQHHKNTSPQPPCSMDEADVQLRHEFNHSRAEATSEAEMAPPLALALPQGPLDALRGFVFPLTQQASADTNTVPSSAVLSQT